MGDNRKADYEMAPSEDPENPPVPEKAEEVQHDSDSQQWSGLGKEELLRVADTPAWNWTRNILLLLFWIAWVIMLIVAIVLVVKAPSCPHLEWHEKSVFYQVFVRSYKDSDGDGYGDLKGLTSKLSDLNDIGVDTVYVSSIYKETESGSRDFGQDIVNFVDIDPIYGNLEDFGDLIEGIQANGMHIVLEFVPNHSSDQHEWFLESQKSANNNHSDFYVWADGVGDQPPNDWRNVYGDSAWTKVESRNQYYYHNLLPEQPDLNYNNEMVKSKMMDAMEFWLNKKVDGFVFTNVDYLLEGPISTSTGNRKRRQSDIATDIPDATETTLMPEGDDKTQYSVIGDEGVALSDAMTELLQDFYDVIEDNSYLGKFRILIPQHSGSISGSVMYQNKGWRGFPSSTDFAKQLVEFNLTTGYTINDQAMSLMDSKTNKEVTDLWNSWMIGNSEISRVASRSGPNAKVLLMLLFTLPGTPIPYYGEELGMVDLSLTLEETKDPVARGDEVNWKALSRDPQRGPYPWNSKKNGGFSDGDSTWLKIAEDIPTINLEAQEKDEDSNLAYFKKLAKYHKDEPSLSAGTFNVTNFSNSIFAFNRIYPEWSRYIVVCNFASNEVNGVNLYSSESNEEMHGKVELSASGKKMEEMVNLGSVSIGGNDAYLISF